MKFVSYDVLLSGLKKNLFLKEGICLGKTVDSFFLGPILSHKLCSNCVYLRTISSVSFDACKFYSLSNAEENSLKKLFQNRSKEIKENDVVEFRNKKIRFTHYIMPVPGCNHKSHEKK